MPCRCNFLDRSRVIAPILRAVLVAVALVALVLERNAIAAVRLATLRVHAPRHPEVVVAQEVMAVGEEGGTAILAAVKKHGALAFLVP